MQSEEYMRAVRLLPPALRTYALEIPPTISETAEEIRLRAGKPMTLLSRGREFPAGEGHSVSIGEIQLALEIATRASAHTYADSIRQGFVTAEGGCRVGICGSAVVESGSVSGMRRVSSVCIRIPRERRGCADTVFPALMAGSFESAILISPPGGGKTTLLRELVRLVSDSGMRVSLEDERGEVSGSFEGKTYFDVGSHTDVLTGAPKAEGIMMLLRAMSPQLIAFDEITDPADVEAASLSANCGVKLLTTAHAASQEEFSERKLYRDLMDRGIFKRLVIIENDAGRRSYTVKELK